MNDYCPHCAHPIPYTYRFERICPYCGCAKAPCRFSWKQLFSFWKRKDERKMFLQNPLYYTFNYVTRLHDQADAQKATYVRPSDAPADDAPKYYCPRAVYPEDDTPTQEADNPVSGSYAFTKRQLADRKTYLPKPPSEPQP
ncbi:MAG TPA: hypothetical protein VKV29_02200 [Chthonomonas sp.]|uniref:hypothetical protein n=1 Tax=Chthonomonas sp. TaxID=2282153 RepID=UPI002B4AC121|nr:hypothetical protein [Chthonomonas sp.]HLH79076.1 hypothetical protein [Chthonomonas sp.]